MPPNLNCLIIEDEPLAIKKIVEYIRMFPDLSLTGTIEDIEDPASFAPDLQATDILFLDLVVSGGIIETLEELIVEIPFLIITSAICKRDYPTFVKERSHYALQKPISPEMFRKCIAEVFNMH
ncbi:hypothetical protein [Sphingobacterium sp. HMA12]|uniref:hypothetical protein n=1 Tax=Sphingobacterium sp. HMA12 TaxID=2050894 RepID=UPI000CEA36C1|nr:hypothetical protein [Sphingobacterium sp. HMA12]